MDTGAGRRKTSGRRQMDRQAEDLRAVVHDIGHAVATATCLLEAVLSAELTEASARRTLELVHAQALQLSALVEHTIQPVAGIGSVSVRSLLAQLAEHADAAGPAKVTLAVGPEPVADLDGVVLWRIFANLIENAARAAGRGGTVAVTIAGDGPIVVEIADDGPGFGLGEAGRAAVGLVSVERLSRALGVQISFESRTPTGTLTRVTLPVRGDRRNGGTGRGNS